MANNTGSADASSGSSLDARGNASVSLIDAHVMHGVGDGQVSVFASDFASLLLRQAVKLDSTSYDERSRRIAIFTDRKAELSIEPGATTNGMPLTRCSSTVSMAGRPKAPCSIGEVSVRLRNECQCCPAFSYTLKSGGEPDSCQQCPTNAVCPGGDMILPMSGYWRSSKKSVQVHKCRHVPCLRSLVVKMVFVRKGTEETCLGTVLPAMVPRCP